MNSHSTTDELYPQNPPLSTTCFQFFFFFFLIDNQKKKTFIKRKKANPSTMEMYYRGKNQEPRLQNQLKQEGKT